MTTKPETSPHKDIAKTRAQSGSAAKATPVTGDATVAAVGVCAAFLTANNRLLDMSAVFPNMVYAMNVVKDLRNQVMQHLLRVAASSQTVSASA